MYLEFLYTNDVFVLGVCKGLLFLYRVLSVLQKSLFNLVFICYIAIPMSYNNRLVVFSLLFFDVLFCQVPYCHGTIYITLLGSICPVVEACLKMIISSWGHLSPRTLKPCFTPISPGSPCSSLVPIVRTLST